jgi:hypothetical protein
MFLLILVPCEVHALTRNFVVMALTVKNDKISSGTCQHEFRHYLPFQSNLLNIILSSVSYHSDHTESEFQNTYSNTHTQITDASTYTNTYS